MSDINANIVIAPIDLNVTVSTNQLSFTPDAISLNMYAGGISTVANGLVANVGDVHIYGGSNGYYLQTNGAGNLSWSAVTALSLNANINNVHISGGVNGYVLQTDGTGNLTWTAQTGGGGGNGSPGGSNTQVQYNNAGAFGGHVGFTYDESTGILNSQYYSGNANGLYNIIGSNVTGYVANATHSNIADLANAVAGANVTGYVANATHSNIADLANAVAGANVTGQVANSLIAGTVYTNAQPNITSVGTLTSLSVTGTTSIQQAIEKMTTVGTGATGTITYDLLNQSILFYTANASGNFSLNYVGNGSTSLNSVMNSNQSMTSTFINTNGVNGYYLTDIQIDSYSRTVNWVAPTAPNSGTINGKDVYTFNILKTASNTYTILGSRVGYI